MFPFLSLAGFCGMFRMNRRECRMDLAFPEKVCFGYPVQRGLPLRQYSLMCPWIYAAPNMTLYSSVYSDDAM